MLNQYSNHPQETSIKMRQTALNNILITSSGRRVELLNAFVKASERLTNGETKVICADAKPELSAACHAAEASEHLPYCTSKDYIEELLKACKKNKVGIVIPTIDTELAILSTHKGALQDNGINVVVSEPDLIEKCADKIKTENMFRELSLNTPCILDKKSAVPPFIIKPIRGSSSVGVEKVYEDSRSRHLEIEDNYMIQELVPDNWIEVSADMYFNKKGELKCCVPRQRIEIRGGEISKGQTIGGEIYNYLCRSFERMPSARGPLTVQLFASPDFKLRSFIEINARFGGGYPMSHLSGADFPSKILQEYLLGLEIDFEKEWEEGMVFVRHDTTTCIKKR